MMMLNVASELSHLEKYRFIMLVSQVILDIASKAKQKNSISKVPMRSKSNHSASFRGSSRQPKLTCNIKRGLSSRALLKLTHRLQGFRVPRFIKELEKFKL